MLRGLARILHSPKSETEKIHNSLIIRVYLCPFDEEI
jgi:hypothetical protein